MRVAWLSAPPSYLTRHDSVCVRGGGLRCSEVRLFVSEQIDGWEAFESLAAVRAAPAESFHR